MMSSRATRIVIMAIVVVFAASGCSRTRSDEPAAQGLTPNIEAVAQSPSESKADKEPHELQKEDRSRYFVSIECEPDSKWGATLNGYPLRRTKATRESRRTLDVTMAIRNGQNHLVLFAEPSGYSPDETVDIEVAVRDLRKPGVVVKTLKQESYHFEKGSPTLKKELTFEASMPFSWTWTSAKDVATLSQEDRTQILEKIKQARSSWEKADWDACLADYEINIKDQAQFMGSSEDEIRAQLLKIYRGLVSETGSRVVMKEADSLTLTAYGKVVLVDPKDGADPWVLGVQYPDQGVMFNRNSSIHEQLIFAKIRGEWRIVQ